LKQTSKSVTTNLKSMRFKMAIVKEIQVERNGVFLAKIIFDGNGWMTELIGKYFGSEDMREIARALDSIDRLLKNDISIHLHELRR